MNSPPTNFIQLEILVTALCVGTGMYCLGRPSDELALHVALYGRLGGEYSWVLHTSALHYNYIALVWPKTLKATVEIKV